MQGADWISVLLQVPLVAVFIFFALQQQKVFNEYLERREEAWRKFLEDERTALTEALRDLSGRVDRVANEVRAVREDIWRLGRPDKT